MSPIRLVMICLLAVMVPSLVLAGLPDRINEKQAIELIKKFSNLQSFVPDKIDKVLVEEDEYPLAQNRWLFTKGDEMWVVEMHQGIVSDYSIYKGKRKRASDELTRSVAMKYLSEKVPKFSKGFYTEVWPGSYRRVTSRGFHDYTNSCRVHVLEDGTIDKYSYEEKPSPEFADAEIMTIQQAESYAGAHLLNGITEAPSVVCEPMEPMPLIVYTPAGTYEVAYAFTVFEKYDDDRWGYAYGVLVNAQTGSTSHILFTGAGDDSVKGVQVTRQNIPKVVALYRNGTSVSGAHMANGSPVVSLAFAKVLAGGKPLSAKAGDMALMLSGLNIPLPAKVIAKGSDLYLPWQALKYLPGVKVRYDAKLNRLDVTTTGTGIPKSSMKKKVQ